MLAWIGPAAAALALGACSPGYESTLGLYEPVSAHARAPLPEEAVVPIVDEIPFGRPYVAIGRIEFSTVNAPAWVDGALQWHARRVGADAVLVLDRSAREEEYTRYVPGSYWGPRYSYGYVYGPRGSCRYVSTWYGWGGYYDSGYAETRVRTRYSVDAEFVILLDRDTFGWIGLRPLEVGNTGELVIDALEPGGPAERAGLRAGDILVRIGDYRADQGMRDFLRNGPAPRVGEAIEVEVRREGRGWVYTVTPEREPGW